MNASRPDAARPWKRNTTRRNPAWSLPLVLLALGCWSCSDPRPPVKLEGPDVENSDLGAPGARQYIESVSDLRKQKDSFFREDASSPLPVEMRAAFQGLEYYPVDPSWALMLPFVKDPSLETVSISTNTGEVRRLTREGYVEFVHKGQTARLHLYREQDGSRAPGSYWMPFVDAGAGRETYPAGRYLDVEVQPDGTVILDFNLAYNPYCAYGLNFVCPLAPRENRVPFLISAGEKGFHR